MDVLLLRDRPRPSHSEDTLTLGRSLKLIPFVLARWSFGWFKWSRNEPQIFHIFITCILIWISHITPSILTVADCLAVFCQKIYFDFSKVPQSKFFIPVKLSVRIKNHFLKIFQDHSDNFLSNGPVNVKFNFIRVVKNVGWVWVYTRSNPWWIRSHQYSSSYRITFSLVKKLTPRINACIEHLWIHDFFYEIRFLERGSIVQSVFSL